MQKTIKWMVIFSLVIGVGSLAISLYNYYKVKKIGYVDTIKLFNQYNLKLDLEKKDMGRLNSIQSMADSLKMVYEAMSKKPDSNKAGMQQIEMQVAKLSQIFNQEYEKSNKDINEKVWKRLNPEIHEFSKEHHLELLVGANGMGTVLYGSDARDYTDQLIKYVNSKY